MDIPHFVYPLSVDGHLFFFHFLAVMNNAAINTCVKVLWGYVFSFILVIYLPWSRIVGSYGDSMFNIFRNCQTIFQKGYIILLSNQQRMRTPISSCPHQHLLLSVFLIRDILMSVKWLHIVVLICILLMTNMLNIFSCAYWSLVCLLW